MTIPEQLKKGVEIASKTNLILSEFLAVIAEKKPVLTVMFHSKSERELIESNFPDLVVFCSKKTWGINKQQKICVISRNKSLAKQAMKYFYNDNRKMGQLLGYPECCIEKYLQVFVPNRMNINSPIITYQSYRNTKKCNFLTNNLFNFSSRIGHKKEELESYQQHCKLNKDFSISLWCLQFIFHIPCKYDCKESIKIGKEIDSLLKEYAPDMEKTIKHTLSRPILFFDLLRLVVFDGCLKEGILYYNKIIPPYFFLENPLMEKIKMSNKINVSDSKV